MLRVVEAGGVGEMRVAQPKLGSHGVHARHEYRQRPAGALDQREGGIVAGLHQHAFEQVLNRYLIALTQKHARPGQPRGIAAHGCEVVQLQCSGTQIAEQQVGGHEFGERGRRQTLVGIVGGQFRAALRIHQYKGARRKFGRRNFPGVRAGR